jgi:signal transduction histidine kinase
MDPEPEIPWQRLAAFVRQHTHDVRNHLNSLDLEAALLDDLVPRGEAKESVARLRRQIREFANAMRDLSGKFGDPPSGRASVPASVLFLIWKDQASDFDPAPNITWNQEVGEARVLVDPDAMARTFQELLANAVAFSPGKPLRAEAVTKDGQVSFTLAEPKSEPIDPSRWGRAPLSSTRRGGYGLGLWAAERSVRASQGEICRRYDAAEKELVTTLSFPAQ